MGAGTQMRKLMLPVGIACALFLCTTSARALEEAKSPEKRAWSWQGPTGHYDRAALQRGFQVFKEVCASCHTLHYVPFRMLADPGGPGFSEAEVKAIAAGYEKEIIDDVGDTKLVPRTPADTFPDPFPNEQTARASNGGAFPPDLSLMTKARPGGPDYMYSLLTGYSDPPAGVETRAGMSYNAYFHTCQPSDPETCQIAMPFQLNADRVTYSDGTAATPEQMADDVVSFLAWAAEPKLEERKRLGLNVMAYLVVLAGLLYFSYRRVWRDKH
jgi:ubiquinol-cytochrome c reductase cytochrome c1 subunit